MTVYTTYYTKLKKKINFNCVKAIIYNTWQPIKINYPGVAIHYLAIIAWTYAMLCSESTEKSNPHSPIVIPRCYTYVFSFCIRNISLNYYVLNQLPRRAHMAVSRGVIFPGSGVERYCYDYRFRRRSSWSLSLILIVVTRNKAQLQNARVHAGVYASVFLAGYAQFHGASCLEYFAHPCARINELDAKKRRNERRPQMNFNEHCDLSSSLCLSFFSPVLFTI